MRIQASRHTVGTRERKLHRAFFGRRRLAAPVGVAVGLLVLTSCMGFTTGATNIAKQPDGSYSAQLNFVGSCGSGEHC
jgi:hypothetical protein